MDFSTNVKVNSNTLGMQIWPAVAYDQERKIFHAVWWHYTGNPGIYYSMSADEGLTWIPNEKVSDSDSDISPFLTLNSGRPAPLDLSAGEFASRGLYPGN